MTEIRLWMTNYRQPILWALQNCYPVALIWLLMSSPMGIHAQSATTRTGHDPLSLEEQWATMGVLSEMGQGKSVGNTRVALDNSPRQQMLLVERYRGSKKEVQNGKAERQSDTYIYDYTTDTLTHFRINLASNEAEVVEELRGVQLPLVDDEIDRAFSLAFNHPLLRQKMQQSFQELTGETLIEAAQLEMKAFTFHADSMPDVVNEYSEACGVHRCAQLLLMVSGNTALNVQPIVDLSRGMVVQDSLDMAAVLHGDSAIDPDIHTESGDGLGEETALDSPESAELGSGSTGDTTAEVDHSTELFLPLIAQ